MALSVKDVFLVRMMDCRKALMGLSALRPAEVPALKKEIPIES